MRAVFLVRHAEKAEPDGDSVLSTEGKVRAAELARMLGGMSAALYARTTIVFLSDNGTAKSASTAPWLPAHAKPTVYDGGLRVPLIITGPHVAQALKLQNIERDTL